MHEPQYVSGVNWNWPASVMVHVHAIIVGDDIEVGEHVRIDAFTVITGKVRIGARTHIGHGAAIFGAGGVVIGQGCSLSPGAKLFTASDDVRAEVLANPQLVERLATHGPVTMGDFSVVGANAVVLPNVTIGDEVQIGANAVVRTDIPNNEVWAGVPAHYLCPRQKLDRARMMGVAPVSA